MNAALLVIIATFAGVLILGILARRGQTMDLEQWTVGGRGFGTILVFVLMAGEIYTTFTFLGGSGYAYGHGGPAFYILSYGCLAYIMSYWMLPPIWRFARDHKLLSQPDFFAQKYNSQALGILVAIVDIIALIPYLVLQFKGLGIIVNTAGYGDIAPATAIWIGAIVVTAYVMISGVRGSAWTAVVKDTLIMIVVLFLGIYLPLHYYGGFGAMFAAIDAARPGFAALPAKGESVAWFDSTVLLTAFGFYMWPHSFGSVFTASSERAFRWNAAMLPLYQLILLFVFFVGFAAILQVHDLKGPDIDLSLLRLSVATFDPWFVGVIGAAGVLTALVPGSIILISAATLLANNLFRAARPNASEATIGRLARLLVPIIALISVYFTLSGGATIVALLLMGYAFVTQLFPSLIASLLPINPVTPLGAAAGILVGVATVAFTTLTHSNMATLFPSFPSTLQDLNIGIVAMILNVVALVIVSMVTRRRLAR